MFPLSDKPAVQDSVGELAIHVDLFRHPSHGEHKVTVSSKSFDNASVCTDSALLAHVPNPSLRQDAKNLSGAFAFNVKLPFIYNHGVFRSFDSTRVKTEIGMIVLPLPILQFSISAPLDFLWARERERERRHVSPKRTTHDMLPVLLMNKRNAPRSPGAWAF